MKIQLTKDMHRRVRIRVRWHYVYGTLCGYRNGRALIHFDNSGHYDWILSSNLTWENEDNGKAEQLQKKRSRQLPDAVFGGSSIN